MTCLDVVSKHTIGMKFTNTPHLAYFNILNLYSIDSFARTPSSAPASTVVSALALHLRGPGFNANLGQV